MKWSITNVKMSRLWVSFIFTFLIFYTSYKWESIDFIIVIKSNELNFFKLVIWQKHRSIFYHSIYHLDDTCFLNVIGRWKTQEILSFCLVLCASGHDMNSLSHRLWCWSVHLWGVGDMIAVPAATPNLKRVSIVI